ncbi:hypothetical protein P4H67_23885 [Paenibacillus lautus]|uniref:hypothetical protein n=1 Tax=Paenibacillus lautus TaxID=1401 RepID=UPI002DBFFCB4|nr:hypothetical protein [Paenibacillus lautus]MEC0309801.1 hypothetical protein [Paenibacillus lautus]
MRKRAGYRFSTLFLSECGKILPIAAHDQGMTVTGQNPSNVRIPPVGRPYFYIRGLLGMDEEEGR